MLRQLRSRLRKGLHRHGNARDHEGCKDNEQGSCDVRAVTVSPASLERKDATQITTASIETSQPVALPESASPEEFHAAISTSARPLPTVSANFTKIRTPAGANDAPTSLPAQLWDRAYNEVKREETELVDIYEKILSRQLQGGPGLAVPEFQPNIIAQNNPDTRRRQMTQLIYAGLERIEREAKVKEGLGMAVDIALSAKNIIKMIANPISATETNCRGIDYVVQKMDWYWSLSSPLLEDLPNHADKLSKVRGELEKEIVDLYKALLFYQIKSVCSYYRNRGLVLLRDIIKLDDWDADLEAIRDIERCFRHDAQAYTAQKVTSHLEQLVNHAQKQETQQMSEKSQQCLKHLRVTNPRDDKRRIEQTKGGLLADSYRWVLDNADFRKWHDDIESRLLWIKGDPGKGKTMLLCGIIDELKSTSDSSLLSFFFCQATDASLNNATAVLRGLIFLLIDQQPSLISHVQKKYDATGNPLFRDRNAWVALSEIFTDILKDPSLPPTHLIIDALDECIEDLNLLLDLVVHTSSVCSAIKWIVSSRNWPIIEKHLNNATHKARLSLELNEESVSAAINTYIQFKVGRLAKQHDYNNHIRAATQRYLSENAQGTFLWVALVCHELANISGWEVEESLRTFPPGLDELYSRMIGQIYNSRHAKLLREILAAVSVVYRPVTLDELHSLVDTPYRVSGDDKALEEIVGLCGSFLTLRARTISFIHQSAKDFLLKQARDEIFPSGMEEVHHTIFSRSLRAMQDTLRRDIYNLRAPGYSIDSVIPPNQDPLAVVRYSCVYWVNHLHDCNPKENANKDLQDGGTIDIFLRKKFLNWLEALSLLKYMSEGIASLLKLERLLETTLFIDLVRDICRFSLYHKWVIENCPLQVYTSALIFSPRRSATRSEFSNAVPKWIIQKPVMADNWSACLSTLEGHSDSVSSTVKIWDPATGECVSTLKGHSGFVKSVAWSHDASRVASASDDETVKIWDPATGECVSTVDIGHNIDHVQFHCSNADLLYTNYGTLDLMHVANFSLGHVSTDHVSSKNFGYSLSNGTWITYQRENLVRLPQEYRATSFAVSGRTVSIGCCSGCVLIFKFSDGKPVI
ncbi:NACHT domain-containing protein [Corynascus similis CBS 632.67]